MHGFPIANGKVKKLSTKLESQKKILEFSGLLAKSHGMNVRDTFKKIEMMEKRWWKVRHWNAPI